MRQSALVFSLLLSTAASVATAQQTYGDWVYYPEFDGFTDEDRSAVRTADLNGSDAALEFRCTPEGLKVIYRVAGHLGGDSNGNVPVRHRIDQNQATERYQWWIMPDRRSAWMPLTRMTEFRAEARAGGAALFEITDPADGETWQDRFSLMGLSAAMNNLSCA